MSTAETGVKARGQRKSATAYRTISEVSDELAVPQHVLRFWETKFSQVRPLKRGGGRRYYRPEDVALLRKIQKLLYDDGFTIKGVQKLLREGRAGPDENGEAVAEQGEGGATPLRPADETVGQPAKPGGLPSDLRAELSDLLAELRALRATLKTFST